MKFIYTALLFLLFHFTSNATVWTVSVTNFQFSPATVNALVGDSIEFDWALGGHTTTCGSALPGTSLPSGAAEWDNPINSGNLKFIYKLTVAGTYNYGCIPHYDFGMKGVIVASGALAVKFGNLTVNSNKSSSLLQWQTFSESNTEYFSIRKSTDAVNFNEIGRLTAAGNSDIVKVYRFEDNDLGNIYKYIYYEVVTVDLDKKESFSAIKNIRNTNVVKDNLILALSPNPITRPGQVQIKFNADKEGDMNVAVFNSSGQRVVNTTMKAFYGVNSGHLHVCDLQKGHYNIEFSLNGKKEIKKIMVL